MHENFVIAQDILIELASQISEVIGVSEGMAGIIALFYMSPYPLSIPMICKRLNLTKGTVSLYLRLLEERKMIVRAWGRDLKRQKFFEMNPHLWRDLAEDMRERQMKRAEITEIAIASSLEALAKDKEEYRGEDLIIMKLLTERLERIREINMILRGKTQQFFADAWQDRNEGAMRRIDVD